MASKIESLAETAFQLIFSADNLTIDKITSIAQNVRRLAASLKLESNRIQKFKIDIHWKSRVINVPKAIDNFKSLIHDLTGGLHDKILEIAKPFETFRHDLALIAQTPPDPQLGKLVTSINAVETFVTQLDLLVGQVDTAIQDALSLTALFDRVLQDIEHLEDLFLAQGSRRTLVTAKYWKRNA